jgi:hypothetical protein
MQERGVEYVHVVNARFVNEDGNKSDGMIDIRRCIRILPPLIGVLVSRERERLQEDRKGGSSKD